MDTGQQQKQIYFSKTRVKFVLVIRQNSKKNIRTAVETRKKTITSVKAINLRFSRGNEENHYRHHLRDKVQLSSYPTRRTFSYDFQLSS